MSFEVNPVSRAARCSLAVLLVAAAAKIAAATGSEGFLENYDPILLLKNRWVNIAVAVVEIACAAALTMRLPYVIKGFTLLWLGLNFVAYRLVSLLSGVETPCSCLGNIGSWVGLTQDQTEALGIGLLLYLLGAGTYFVIAGSQTPNLSSLSHENRAVHADA